VSVGPTADGGVPADRGTTYEIELSNLGSETRSHEPSMNRDEVLP
jgi:hypothetical protein